MKNEIFGARRILTPSDIIILYGLKGNILMKKYFFVAFFIFIIIILAQLLLSISILPIYLTFWIDIFAALEITAYLFYKFENETPSAKFHVVAFVYLFSVLLINSEILHGKKLAAILDIKENNISSIHFQKQRSVTHDMAYRMANKILGKKVNGIQISSQYELGKGSVQLVNNKLLWVFPLDYSGFFKWLKQEYIPGYVTVSATNPKESAKLHLGYKIKYSFNSYFFKNIDRVAYLNSRLLDVYTHFEIDENGNPYYVSLAVKPTVVFKGNKTVKVIVTNAQSGKSINLSFKNAHKKFPWIDRLVVENFIDNQIYWYGTLSKGWLNKIFSEENVIVPTEYEERELWLAHVNSKQVFFTGMTSVNTNDQSLVQGVIVDTQTAKAISFDLSGVMDESGAVSVLDSALGADSTKWKAVLPQPFIINKQFYWGAPIVSNSNIYEKAGIVNGRNVSDVHFAKSFDDFNMKLLNKNKTEEYIKIKKSVLKKILYHAKEIEKLEKELY